jgi:hypothetical protein
MSIVSHEPGPWKTYTDNAFNPGALYVAAKDRQRDEAVCLVAPCDNIKPVDLANARLIAAAPDLLSAAEAVLDALGCSRLRRFHLQRDWHRFRFNPRHRRLKI